MLALSEATLPEHSFLGNMQIHFSFHLCFLHIFSVFAISCVL